MLANGSDSQYAIFKETEVVSKRSPPDLQRLRVRITRSAALAACRTKMKICHEARSSSRRSRRRAAGASMSSAAQLRIAVRRARAPQPARTLSITQRVRLSRRRGSTPPLTSVMCWSCMARALRDSGKRPLEPAHSVRRPQRPSLRRSQPLRGPAALGAATAKDEAATEKNRCRVAAQGARDGSREPHFIRAAVRPVWPW